MWRRFLLVAVLLTGFTAFAFSQARPVLGILPFTGGSGGDGEAIATIIAMEPEIMRAFTVVPRNLAAVLLPFVMRRKICFQLVLCNAICSRIMLPIISSGLFWVNFAIPTRYSAVVLSTRTIGMRIRAFEGSTLGGLPV